MRWIKWIAVALGVWLLLLVCSTTGGRNWFSPDTLAGKTQGEQLVWIVALPVYCMPISDRRYALADYLVEQGYWRPRTVAEPEWWLTQHWNTQWRDGHVFFHRTMAWDADDWIEWTQETPATAAEMWPMSLRFLRDKRLADRKLAFLSVLFLARHSESVDAFRDQLRTHPELAEARAVCPDLFGPYDSIAPEALTGE